MSTLPLTAGDQATHDASSRLKPAERELAQSAICAAGATTVTVASNKFRQSVKILALQKIYRSTPEYKEHESKRRKSDPSRQSYYRILETSRAKDKKAGLENNLTKEIVTTPPPAVQSTDEAEAS
jgi:hypothetical protein